MGTRLLEVHIAPESRSASGLRKQVDLSIIVPVNNEFEGLSAFYCELSDAVARLPYAVEIIWVDDGSNDGTPEELKRLSLYDEWNRLVRLPNQSGQSAALWEGFLLSGGNTIVTLDGDGQIVPAEITRVLDALDDCDLAIGRRFNRADGVNKRVFSFLGNRLRNLLTGSSIPDSGCSLRAFRRDLIRDLIPFAALHRFLPSLVEMNGGKVLSIDVSHRPRKAGSSHYGLFSRGILSVADCLALAWLLKVRGIPRRERTKM